MKINKKILKAALEVYCKTNESESLDEATKRLWKLLKHYKKTEFTKVGVFVGTEDMSLDEAESLSQEQVKLREKLENGEKVLGYFTNDLQAYKDLLHYKKSLNFLKFPDTLKYGQLIQVYKNCFFRQHKSSSIGYKYFVEV